MTMARRQLNAWTSIVYHAKNWLTKLGHFARIATSIRANATLTHEVIADALPLGISELQHIHLLHHPRIPILLSFSCSLIPFTKGSRTPTQQSYLTRHWMAPGGSVQSYRQGAQENLRESVLVHCRGH
ncbi:hypothetical protein M378DRAFT_162027 [Amanita muscaria Koide BX008]|uniref:Uncharacterized protein n=1 Tax=Amanita muscaria (strain Koide BX008) TaxID=946122 RepID=A0A0C2X7X2_AMAMK|nr:hypothetical protein M378DRAFT_162027 [Amanita muscaria Koide BX008]